MSIISLIRQMYLTSFFFADDTTILYLHSNTENQIDFINEELSKVRNWFKANKLSVNARKTNYLILRLPHVVLRFDIFGNQISKWRSFEKRVIFDLLFPFFSHQGKLQKFL